MYQMYSRFENELIPSVVLLFFSLIEKYYHRICHNLFGERKRAKRRNKEQKKKPGKERMAHRWLLLLYFSPHIMLTHTDINYTMRI